MEIEELVSYTIEKSVRVFWHPHWPITLVSKKLKRSPVWVYLMRAEQLRSIKIGKTDTPERRLSGVHNANADEINRILLMNNNVLSEGFLQNYFKYLNYKGEWHTNDSKFEDFIKGLQKYYLTNNK